MVRPKNPPRRRKSAAESAVQIARAAIYCRISNVDDERTGSLDTQAESGLNLAKSRGFVVDDDDVYKEKWTGAELYDRPVLSRIRELVRQGRYGALICHVSDRLARDPIHIAIIYQECERHKCELIFVTEPLDNSDEAGLIRYVKGYAAKIEREKIKERTIRGKEAVMSKGQLVCNGWATYGYKYDKEVGNRHDDGTRARVIDEETAGHVRMIFDWADEGRTAGWIARTLNQMGILSPRERLGHNLKIGRKALWRCTTVCRILRDESYIGKTYWGVRRNTGERDASGRPKQEIRPREEWREFEGMTPAIIDKTQYDRVQSYLDDRHRQFYRKNGGKGKHLLRGRITCDKCGAAMYPTVRSAGTRVYNYYFCRTKMSAREEVGRCDGKMTPCEHADGAVWSWICDLHDNPEMVRERFEQLGQGADDSGIRSMLDSIAAEASKAARMASKWKTAELEEEDPELSAEYAANCRNAKQNLARLREEEAMLKGRLAALDAGRAAAQFTEEMLRAAGDKLRRDADFETRMLAVEALAIEVVANGKEYTVRFRPPASLCSEVSSISRRGEEFRTWIEFAVAMQETR